MCVFVSARLRQLLERIGGFLLPGGVRVICSEISSRVVLQVAESTGRGEEWEKQFAVWRLWIWALLHSSRLGREAMGLEIWGNFIRGKVAEWETSKQERDPLRYLFVGNKINNSLHVVCDWTWMICWNYITFEIPWGFFFVLFIIWQSWCFMRIWDTALTLHT